MDVTLKYANGQETTLSGCTVSMVQRGEDVHFGGDTFETMRLRSAVKVEVPMSYDNNRSWTSQLPLGIYSTPEWEMWGSSGFVRLGEQEQQVERRDKMISRRVFNEALAEEGISKSDRRKVEKLSEADFEYLIAALLAKAFKPSMLDVFEPDVQKVKVVEG